MDNKGNNESWISIAGIWFGCIASMPALLIGSSLIVSLTIQESIFVAFIGYSFVLVFLSFLSIKSVQLRLNAVQLAQRSFGTTGSKTLVGLIIGIASMVWFGVQTNIAGISFSKIIEEISSVSLPVSVSSLFWGLVMVLTAVFGFKYVKWLNLIAVPSILILVTYGLIVTLRGVSASDLFAYEPSSDISILKAIGVIIGLIAVGGVISPDYNRFAKTPKTAVIGSVVGMLPAAIAFLVIGAILAILKGTHDIVDIFSKLGYPIMAMSILILITWTSNVMSAYSGGLGLNSTFHLTEKHRATTTLIVGLIGTILGVFGILDKFIDVAFILSAMIPPIAGVIISDYYLCKNHDERIMKFNWIGIVSWLLGVGIVFLLESEVKNLLGIPVSGLVYWLLHQFTRQDGKKAYWKQEKQYEYKPIK